MRVAVGSDHAGFDLKEILRAELTALDHDVADAGIAKLAELDRELVHQTTPEGNP